MASNVNRFQRYENRLHRAVCQVSRVFFFLRITSSDAVVSIYPISPYSAFPLKQKKELNDNAGSRGSDFLISN